MSNDARDPGPATGREPQGHAFSTVMTWVGLIAGGVLGIAVAVWLWPAIEGRHLLFKGFVVVVAGAGSCALTTLLFAITGGVIDSVLNHIWPKRRRR